MEGSTSAAESRGSSNATVDSNAPHFKRVYDQAEAMAAVAGEASNNIYFNNGKESSKMQ